MSRIGRHPVAINPLQFMATPDGWFDFGAPPPAAEILAAVAEAGFGAVQAAVPAGTAPRAYADELARWGLAVGPGYVALGWSEDAAARRGHLEQARTQAAALAACGADLAFVGLDAAPDGARMARPAVGLDACDRRLDRIAAHVGAAAEILAAEGVTAALHPHVGTWIETGQECARVLDLAGPALGFGPDIGHLAWAGADVPGLVGRYRPRVAGLHLKDMARAVADEARAAGLDYRGTVAAGLWREPGDGDLEPAALVAALGPVDDCWLVVEVDHSALPPRDSVLRCGRWVQAVDAAFRAG
ncbi:sugar phosphate isomerase/epimerase family protein [Streptomyces sp. CA2R106]|uniref:sugar phosphate isomerase/epimerase family protein n=1 Tax=Streptomyces sp. CA2R106 TaxID=3120153 RepID=UPI003009656F